ncbi:acyl-CoA dehydrogenase [Natronomonas moolapensis 8.8.11]|uniref:Acyl-CoA dehydrogenase n=1 Tax=Natronomonas moolapensis (strain DSM 18674 / CECT 7526 / JCM 14361 / 8.8.11) TaxID=268739 RepID=M1XQM4_NATM8|nr:acyl-CoA dehydrogenase family protein [Natronomonas moolapensis]CCQ36446.1 acyl-CoA dehydrogenase [Natronomonas moolapensis 8.8.11]
MNLLTDTPIPDGSHDIKARARTFADERIRPEAMAHDATGEFPIEILRAAQEAGLAGRYFSEAYGGSGWTLADRLAIIEEWFRADGGIGLALQLADFGAKVVAMHGSDEQRSEWLPPVAEENLITGLAATEPRGGSDLAGMGTTARRAGDEYVLDGEKYWTSNGVVADWVVVYARTGDDGGHDAYSLFIVPTDSPGYEAEAIDDKTGLRASQQARVELDGVRVPASNLLGEPNRGFYRIAEFFNYGRIVVAGHGIGLAAAAIEAAWDYVHDRELYDGVVADKQTVRHELIDMRERFEAARALTWTACRRVAAGEDPAFWASLAKRRATEAAESIAGDAAQLHGGEGLREENRINKIHRDSSYPSVYEGANAVQRDIAYGHWPDRN